MKSKSTPRGALVRTAFVIGCLATHAAAVEIAGSLLIDLEASDYNTVDGLWPQNSLTGIQGSFAKQPTGTPKLETIAGATALVFDGDGDFLTGPNSTSALHAAGATHSVEYWAFQGQIRPEEAVLSWSRREGPDGTFAGFRYASNNAYGAAARWGGPDMGFAAPHLNGPAAGSWHHIVVTYDGSTQRVYVNGALNATEAATLDAKDGFPIFIGTERLNNGNDAGRFFQYSGALSKVRIHSGALSDAQVLANYNEELPAHPGITPAPLPQAPLHRFSFNEPAAAAPDGTVVSDSIGGLTARIRGNGATFTGTGVQLPGGAPATLPAYIDLPNGLISSKQRITIEAWSTQTTHQAWSRFLSFSTSNVGEINTAGNVPGFNGAESIAVYSNTGGTAANYRLERLAGTFPNGANNRQSEGGTVLGVEIHHAVTYDPATAEWRLYRNGYLMEVLPETQGPTTIEDVNNWLGRSEYGADNGFNGVFNEFRVYNYALNESQIRGNTVAGPNTLNLAAGVDLFTWTPTTGGSFAFNNAGAQDNWATGPGGSFPDAVGANANLVSNLTGDQSVELNTTITLGSLTFGDPDGSHKFTVAAGSGGSLEMSEVPGFTASINQSSTSLGDEISAPLVLTTETEIANLGSAPMILSGALSGSGRLVKGGHGPLVLTADNSGYPGAVAVNTGTLRIGNGGTTGTLGSGVVSTTDESQVVVNRSDPFSFTQTVTGVGAFTQAGAGTLTNNGNIAVTGRININDGTSMINAATIDGTNSIFSDGSLLLPAGSTTTPNGFVSIGVVNGGTLTVEGGATMTVNGGGDFNIGDVGTGQSSMFMTGGSVNAGTVWLGKNGTTSGIIVQSGGDFLERAGGGDNRLGGVDAASAAAFGSWTLTGGTLSSNNNFQIGAFGTGIMTVDGGSVSFNGGFPVVGRFQNGAVESYGLLDVLSGSVSQTQAAARLIIAEAGVGVLNVRGSGIVNLTGGLMIGHDNAGVGNGTANLLPGGLIDTQLVGQFNPATAQGVLNFHGGVLRAKGDNASFIGSLDRAYIYPGGAILEVPAGVTVGSDQNFDAPTGDGVLTIPVTNGGSGYLAAPFIEITGGGGSGATAVANLSGDTIASITVTNPGVDYTSAPDITVRGGGAGTGLLLGTPTLGANASGGLTKTGEGTLELKVTNFQTGPTVVQQGTLLVTSDQSLATGDVTVDAGATLGGNGVLGSDVIVNGDLAPGPATGQLDVTGNVSFAAGSAFVVDIDEALSPVNDLLAVTGDITIAPGSTLEVNLNSAATMLPYTIATATGTISGTFTAPVGTTVVYTPNSITLTAVGTPFQNWINGFPSIPVDQRDPEDDPDGDGAPNSLEFALGGAPDDGSNQPKIYQFAADSDDGGTDEELLMTIAVRAGTPAFAGDPSPSASRDGFTYTLEGSTDLSGFAVKVNPVGTVLPPSPDDTPPAGYEYRTFSLDGSNGLPGRGFLRVNVTP